MMYSVMFKRWRSLSLLKVQRSSCNHGCWKRPWILLILILTLIGIIYMLFRSWLWIASITSFNFQRFIVNESSLNDPQQPFRIPRILHQTWFSNTEKIPQHWQRCRESCGDSMTAEWKFKLWDRERSRQLIAVHFPLFLPVYDNYPHEIQRIDAARYAIIMVEGGVYVDLDIGCRRSLDPLLQAYDLVLAKTSPLGISNDFFAASPNHPFMQHVMHAIQTSDAWWKGTKYSRVMFSTGPVFFSHAFTDWAAMLRRQDNIINIAKNSGSIAVLSDSLYGNQETSFFVHVHGSSWHDWDAVLVLSLYHQPLLWATCGASLIAAIVCAVMIYRHRMRSISNIFEKNVASISEVEKRV